MTSNLGSDHFRKLTNPLGFLAQQVGVDQVRGEIMRELERSFSPEFRNRIDQVVREIARRYLATVQRTLSAAGKTIRIDEGAVELLVRQGYSLACGARFLKRVIDERVKLPTSVMRLTVWDISRFCRESCRRLSSK